MKKILSIIVILFCMVLITACGKETKESVLNKIDKKVNNTNGYILNAEMELINNEDKYEYDVIVSYKKKDYYRVSLKNKINNHEQIILKNKDGVYVLTPSLNKSFKFQSKWPYNSSQSYLLQSIMQDLKSDSKLSMKKNKGNYIFKSSVNYKNNPDLKYQLVEFDKNLNIKNVTVYDKDNNVCIKVKFNNIDMKSRFKNNYFELKENMETSKENSEEETTTENTSVLDEAVYPMYLPDGTYLDTEKTVDLDKGSRVILTFAGEKPFMLVEETASREDELSVIPTSGDLDMIADTVAIVGETSVNWTTNGVEYYLVSSDMNKSELLMVAKSISVMPISK